MAHLAAAFVFCSGLAAAATSYNLERDFKTSGTRAVAFFKTDPLLGVPSADSSAPAAGIVKHFQRGDGALLRTLESPAPATGDRFGFSIAVAGALIIVGAPGDDAAGVDSGAAFVFDGATGAHVRTLHGPSPTANAQFGFSIASRGDDIIVGAPFAGGAQVDAGAAYLFDGASGDLLLTFTNDDASGDDFFGAAVASAGNDVLVGAPLDSGQVESAGAAFLFDGATGARLNVFRAPQAAEGHLFGASVAPIGGDVIIGAPFADGNGAVYRFDRMGGTPSKTYVPPDIPPSGATAFGTALATVGRDFLVSAPGGELEQNPAAFVIDGATGNVIQTLFPLVPIPLRDRFEPPLAASGRDVLVEDALFESCGRACVEECGNGIVEADLAETCDDGDNTNSLCPDCVRGSIAGNQCDRCVDGDLCTLDVCCIPHPEEPLSCTRCDSPNGCTLCTPQGCFKCRSDLGPCDVPCGPSDECLTCDPNACATADACVYPVLPGCDCHSDDDCRDADVCNGGERCRKCAGCFLYEWPCCDRGSRCAQSEPLQCDDHDPCTMDSCDPQTGCHADAGACPVTTSTTSTTTSPTSTSPEPSVTSTSTSPTSPVTSSTVLRSIPGAICLEDADCSGNLCDGTSRCIEGRCRPGQAPVCFEGATCVLSAGLPLTPCPEAPPARVTRLFERAYVLVLGAEAAAPSSLKRAKRRLRAAAGQLTRGTKLVGALAGKDKFPPSCTDTLRAAITSALERTNSVRTNLTACAS